MKKPYFETELLKFIRRGKWDKKFRLPAWIISESASAGINLAAAAI